MEGKTEAAKEINSYLDTFEQKVYRIKKLLIDRDEEITAELIKQKLLGIDVDKNKHMLIQIFKEHNKQVHKLLLPNFSIFIYSINNADDLCSLLVRKYTSDALIINGCKGRFE